MADCLFCKIIKGDIPSQKVYEDEMTYAFRDISPQTPTHVLVVPKVHVANVLEAAQLGDDVLAACYDVGVAVQDGRQFLGKCHMRMNLASPLSRIQEAFDRLDKYVFNA